MHLQLFLDNVMNPLTCQVNMKGLESSYRDWYLAVAEFRRKCSLRPELGSPMEHEVTEKQHSPSFDEMLAEGFSIGILAKVLGSHVLFELVELIPVPMNHFWRHVSNRDKKPNS